jgi:16S rRNA A1518/A1519 N6-dimethyltransferase RsmA/KsgA/DIM1 with predicted DNA glycosylase/AP lyase activity
MTGMLNIQETDTILEPCGGDGVFVDKILTSNSKANICIFELNPAAVSTLKDKYRDYGNIKIVETDTLLNPSILRSQKLYDKIIGNPPYGARNNE